MEEDKMNKIALFGLVVMLIFVSGCVTINSFDDCIKAGNPAMESYPRQCSANGRTFVEVIKKSEEQIVGGCGTVTPGLENECCANENKDVKALIACAGEWKWDMQARKCKFLCITREVAQENENKISTTEFIKCQEAEDKQTYIQCVTDSDCSDEKLQSACSNLILPLCITENFCVEGLCKFNCD